MSKKEQTISPERYCVIPRVLVFIFNENERVLLLKGAPGKKNWPGLWNGIGGHVEAGESILKAAKREILEETGKMIAELIYCGNVMVDIDKNPGIHFHIFKSTGNSEVVRPSPEGELAWFTLETAMSLPLVEDLLELLPKVFSFKAGDPLMYGIYCYNGSDELVVNFDDACS